MPFKKRIQDIFTIKDHEELNYSITFISRYSTTNDYQLIVKLVLYSTIQRKAIIGVFIDVVRNNISYHNSIILPKTKKIVSIRQMSII